MKMTHKTAQHILNTSGNLLGFCLIVITSLQITNKSQGTLLDEFTSVVAVLLTFSCIFSFISIKSTNDKRGRFLETIADLFFIVALVGLLFVILFITFVLVK